MMSFKLVLTVFLMIFVSCSKNESSTPPKAQKVNPLIGSNPTNSGERTTAPVTSTPSAVVALPVTAPVVTPTSVKPPPVVAVPTVPAVPTTPTNPTGPTGSVVIAPQPNEQQLVSTGTPINANGVWSGHCQISLNGKVQTSCFLELEILQRPDSFCPSTFYVTPFLSQGTDFLAITAVSTSLIQYASAHMGLFNNYLMSILDCEILVNFDPGHQAIKLGTVGQGGFKYKDAKGLVEMKGLFVNNAWQITYKTGSYLLEAVLQ